MCHINSTYVCGEATKHFGNTRDLTAEVYFYYFTENKNALTNTNDKMPYNE